jgi:beta-galactosidase
VGNGNGEDNASYQGDRRTLFQGRALVVVRTTKQSGPSRVNAAAAGLRDRSATIEAKPVAERAELQ